MVDVLGVHGVSLLVGIGLKLSDGHTVPSGGAVEDIEVGQTHGLGLNRGIELDLNDGAIAASRQWIAGAGVGPGKLPIAILGLVLDVKGLHVARCRRGAGVARLEDDLEIGQARWLGEGRLQPGVLVLCGAIVARRPTAVVVGRVVLAIGRLVGGELTAGRLGRHLGARRADVVHVRRLHYLARRKRAKRQPCRAQQRGGKYKRHPPPFRGCLDYLLHSSRLLSPSGSSIDRICRIIEHPLQGKAPEPCISHKRS